MTKASSSLDPRLLGFLDIHDPPVRPRLGPDVPRERLHSLCRVEPLSASERRRGQHAADDVCAREKTRWARTDLVVGNDLLVFVEPDDMKVLLVQSLAGLELPVSVHL